jgi:sensor histidine kinase YesM
MILQPLVENAIRHGLEGATTGRITIVARRAGGRMMLEVRDNGRGFDTRPLNRDLPSVGLANTRTRLDKLYGANATFEIGSAGGTGTLVTIALPATDGERRAG